MNNKKTVLIIEDDQDIRELFFEIFSSSDYDVTLAENGKIGLEKLQHSLNTKTLPELVLVDMLMPVLNGMEMIEILKLEYPETLARLPFIITSAKEHEELKNMKITENFIIVKKPMDVDELLEKADIHSKKYALTLK